VSIIQAAIERLQANRAAHQTPRATHSRPARTDARIAAESAAAGVTASLPSAIVWPQNTGPVVEIDAARLADRGLYAHAAFVSRQQEDYRVIRREVIAATRAKTTPEARAVGPVAVVTSALAGEGKTYTALNLALSIASEGVHDVLLVDADTVRRSLTLALDLDGVPGLLELLRHPDRNFMDYALRTSIQRLRVLPAGLPFAGASDLFSFGRVGPLFAAMNSALSAHVAIVDTAPLLLSSDTPMLADSAGQVLLVVRAGKTLQDSVRDAISRIKESVPVGLVLNDWDPLLASERQAYYGYEAYRK